MNRLMHACKHANLVSAGIRWTARISGLLLVLMVVAFAFGMRPPNVFGQPAVVQIEFVAMGLMLAAFLLGWRWEVIGGTLAVVGFIAFCCVELAVNAALPGGALPLFLIPGVLLLISGLLSCDSHIPPTA